MSLLSPAINRVCLAVDMESYSRRDNVEQFREQTRLDTIVRTTCEHARVDHDACLRQDSGDGVILLLPPDVNLAEVVPDLLEGLRRALSLDNRGSDATRRIRLRVSLGQGTVHVGPTGFPSGAVVETCRVLNSGPLKEALRHAAERDLVVGVTDHFHREVVRHGYPGLDPSGFRSLHLEIPDKGFTATVWIDAPVPAPGRGPAGGTLDGPVSGSTPTADGHPAPGSREEGTGPSSSRLADRLRKAVAGAEAGFAVGEMLHHRTDDDDPPDPRSPAADGATTGGGPADGHDAGRSHDHGRGRPSANNSYGSEPGTPDDPDDPGTAAYDFP